MEPDRDRGRRIAAGVIGLGVFAGAVWLTTTGGSFRPAATPTSTPTRQPTAADTPTATDPARSDVSERVGFVGLPPEGALPSRPRSGELVLSYFGQRFTHWYEVWVYADGRMIWQREGDMREGANVYSTGFLEQRLSPVGVELLRRRGSAGAALFGFPWRPPYPASWLPPRAWEDRTIRAYVPSRFAVCYQGLWRPIATPQILAGLPVPAAEGLRAGRSDVTPGRGWVDRFGGDCSELTTGEARAVAEALEDAGLRQDQFQTPYALVYYARISGALRSQVYIRFEPILPHGEIGCSACG